MARNEILVQLESRQLADIKKSIKQSQMKTESEISKLRREVDRLRCTVNDILNEIRLSTEKEELYERTEEAEKERSSCENEESGV